MSMLLSEIVQSRIREEGPISFHDFMEMALYHSEFGYYTSSKEKFGKGGDYFTAPFLTKVYGGVIAKQLEEMWLLTGQREFKIVEYGAGLGSLCTDILHHLKSNKSFYKKVSYCIIEKSDSLRQRQKDLFNNSDDILQKITWVSSIDQIPSLTGCVMANEVLDNFSVHKVVMKADGLKEIFVGYENGFIEILKPAHEDLENYFSQLDIELPNDFCAEVNLEAIDWLKNISSSLEKGFVLTIDYGYPSSELYQTHRRLGTIVCYNKHTVNDLPYQNIGQQDITAHVNFSALKLWGTKYGLNNCGFTNQSQFLLGLGLTEHLRKMEEREKSSIDVRKKLLAVHTLLMSMGKKFKVFIQHKGLCSPKLSGLQFCQPLI